MIPLAVVTPQGSADRSGPLAVTNVGAVRTVDADFGKAWFVEEGTTNLSNQGTFTSSELPSTTWIDDDGNTVTRIERVATGGWINAGSAYSSAMSYTSGTTFTWSVDIRGYRSGGSTISDVRLQPMATGGSILGSVVMTGKAFYPDPTAWDRLIRTGTNTLDCDFVRVNPDGIVGPSIGDWVELRRQQIEAKPYATTFCPQTDVSGNLLPGYSWTGTPHASASVRSDAMLTIPHATRHASILVRHRVPDSGTVTTSHLTLDGSDRATFGTDGVGVIEWDGTVLTVRSTDADLGYVRQFELMGIATFADIVSPGVIPYVNTVDWDWNLFSRSVVRTGFPVLVG